MTPQPATDALIVGAGIAGLTLAMALHDKGFKVTILERDPAPPHETEATWRRPGVPHALQPHFFMGRLRELIGERYPRLLESMRHEGVGEGAFARYIHPSLLAHYRPRPEDATLTVLAARRTSLERLMRRYVEQERLAAVISDATVRRLLFADGEDRLRVCGAEVEVRGRVETFRSDLIIDASGRHGNIASMLLAAGARFDTERSDCSILYFTRWYRLLPRRKFPVISGLSGQIYDDFVAGALPADNGLFSVTLQVHKDDPEFVALAKDPERFEALCRALPAIAPWIEPERAEPLGEIHGFGMMDYFWRSLIVDDVPQVLGFFFIGDTAIRSNPKFGRGCTWAALGAHLLADTLAEISDPEERLKRYERRLRQEFRTDWMTMRALERSTRRRFEIAAGKRRANLRDRISSFLDRRVQAAIVVDPVVFRAVWSGYHGFTTMDAWTRRPVIWARILIGAVFQNSALTTQLRRRPSRAEIFAMQQVLS
jgi:2-polyprenyl-6-methoxyphenol hydroxylase-like FAD-dependent oxidoreductase